MALTAAVALLTVVLAVTRLGHGELPDALGWGLLAVAVVPLAWRLVHPLTVLLLMTVSVGPYHAMDYAHAAAVPASVVAVYSVAVVGPRLRTVAAGAALIATAVSIMLLVSPEGGLAMFQTAGWVLVVLVFGEMMRIQRNYVAAVTERAERAERTREEEAARAVAEERLRIARDLHDLLAHSITLIGVQTSVASHVLIADPDRLDRPALARALDGISATCRDARTELRRTLEVLRAGEPEQGPPPGPAGLPDLVRAAGSAGARVRWSGEPLPTLPPAVGAAVYRIVQESLTNAVRHAGAGVAVALEVAVRDREVVVSVTDGGGDRPPREGDGGFGILGMRERVRSVGGTLLAQPRSDGPGFAVRAVLPLPEPPGDGAGEPPGGPAPGPPGGRDGDGRREPA
ncbi:sensor histidine kinase [Streptomyces lonarensis]|uniref:sensor histidine kinase n=1 Tax=Streptomyces lonarensis TaxID=700599 RepID=UPI0028A6C7CA|nr:histidine kinase [Streptomyces lonarensis]